MPAPSLFEMIGLSIQVSQPILRGGSFLENLTNKYDGYNHIISAAVGFDTATIEINGDLTYCESWFEDGLTRDITVYNQAGYIVWQGWVNQVQLAVAGLNVTTGPVLNIANRVEVVYSPLDTTVTPPAIGTRTRTAQANNTASQAAYGIWHKLLSGSNVPDAEALQLRSTYLQENALPETASTINFDASDAPKITLNCLGYAYWLQAYPYNVAGTGTIAISTRLQAVLTASPNAVLSANYSYVNSNTFAVPVAQEKDTMALDYIKSLVAVGDSANNRWTFGIYEDRQAYYSVIPTTAEYQYQLSEGAQTVRRYADNTTVRPWDVRPAKWLFITDFLIGRVASSTMIRDDPRMLFIESVNYAAPYSLSVQGAKISTIAQQMAKLGLGGI
jgi:hypothetical protein